MLFRQSYANKINLLFACVFLNMRENKNRKNVKQKNEEQKMKRSRTEENMRTRT